MTLIAVQGMGLRLVGGGGGSQNKERQEPNLMACTEAVGIKRDVSQMHVEGKIAKTGS